MNSRLLFVLPAVLLYSSGAGQSPLWIPELISGEVHELQLQAGTHEFIDDIATETMGCNGDVLGPTIALYRGQEVQFHVVNGIMDTTTMHWHGMHVSPAHDGGPHSKIPPGETWSPQFEVLDHAGTYWYHPHLHHMTHAHVSKGVAGMIWVRDEVEQALPLPRTYGVDEFPLIVQTKAFDQAGQILLDSKTDATVMVNATVDPVLDIPAQWMRFHVLNGASERVFNLGLEGDLPFHLIASEGGLLGSPVELTRMRLAPGERCEIMVDAQGLEGDTLRLMSFASEFPNGVYGATFPGMGAGMSMTGYNPNPLNGSDFNLLHLAVGPSEIDPGTELPAILDPGNANPWMEDDADLTRILTMTPQSMGMNALNGNFLFNGQAFDMMVINEHVQLGDIEIWNLQNNSPIGHPFHIHDVQFHILDRNGVPPSPEEAGRKDVVFVPAMQSVRFITRFEDFADPDIPYMYHCHMLPHEDAGMMGQFLVLDGTSDIAEGAPDEVDPTKAVFPVPASDMVHLSCAPGPWSVWDAFGRKVMDGEATGSTVRLSVSDWDGGPYMFLGSSGSRRFLVQH